MHIYNHWVQAVLGRGPDLSQSSSSTKGRSSVEKTSAGSLHRLPILPQLEAGASFLEGGDLAWYHSIHDRRGGERQLSEGVALQAERTARTCLAGLRNRTNIL